MNHKRFATRYQCPALLDTAIIRLSVGRRGFSGLTIGILERLPSLGMLSRFEQLFTNIMENIAAILS